MTNTQQPQEVAPALEPILGTQETPAQETILGGQEATAPEPSGTKPTPEGLLTGREDEAPEAPEELEEYNLQLDEGVHIDSVVLSVFSEIAKELNLPQESAQTLLNKVIPVFNTRQMEQIKDVQNGWYKSAVNDPEFGGHRLKTSVWSANKALKTYGTPAFIKLLEESGLQNHPEMVRFAFRVGSTLKDDKVISAGGKPDSGKTDASFYNKSSHNA